MKTSRQNVILEIIAEQNIETQGQMLEALQARGVSSTQATVSRDIKELRLVKEIGPDGRYRYAPAGEDEASEAARRMEEIFREGCISFDHALHTVVVRTMPGLASATPPRRSACAPSCAGPIRGKGRCSGASTSRISRWWSEPT